MARPRYFRVLTLGLLLGLGLLPGCRATEQAPGVHAGKSKVHADEVETRDLRLLGMGGSQHVLTQETPGGTVQAMPLSTDWLSDRAILVAVWNPQTLRNKRILPRRLVATITDARVTFPGPADADRILLQIPDTLPPSTVLQIALPLPPRADQIPVEAEEGLVLRVESAQTYRVTWDAGYVLAAGLPAPATITNHSYFRLEYDGNHWLLVAMPGTSP